MNEPPTQWERVQAIFHDALERAPSERARYVAEASSGDDDLAAEVLSLLEAAAEGDASLLDAPLDDLVLLLDEERTDAATLQGAPRRAGPYRILELIGQGGMGTVYRAVRDDDHHDREVAIKVVRGGLGDPDAGARFARERRILAGLEHPGIARLYDTGVTAEGDPYLSMELVRGLPIHRYCDEHGFSIDRRLLLFEGVCEAVDFAHQRLVIHRDLKPSNVLVHDDGAVKLLDFGIAKLLTPDPETERASGGDVADALTRPHQRLLTPEYASPEQIAGAPLTTASDVFSLGVLLHHLLTGTVPARDRDGAATTSPSRSLSGITGGAGEGGDSGVEARAARRGTDARKLRASLQGEIDAIVLKAMAPSREDRYPTVSALLDDLRRYRMGLPISARAPSAAYRARKFVARNRAAVAGAVAFVGLLAGSSAVLAVQQRRTARERDRAEVEATKARQVTDFMLEMLAASDPGQARGEDVSVREVLDAAAERLGSELADQPDVRLEMHRVIGEVYRGLGALDASRDVLLAGLALRDSTPGLDPATIASLLSELGSTEENLGRYEEAEVHYLEALEIQESMDAPPSERSATYLNLGLVYTQAGRLEEAEPLLRRAVAIDRAAMVADTSSALGYSLNNLAIFFYSQGALDEAIAVMTESLGVRQRTHGRTHPRTATTVNNLAALLTIKGDYEAAEPIQREALALHRELHESEHPDIANALHNLGANLAGQQKWEEAEASFTEALAMNRRLLGEEHSEIVSNLHAMGLLARDRGRHEEALALLREAAALSTRVNGPTHVDTGTVFHGLGTVYLATESWTTAETNFRQADVILTEAVGPEHFRTAGARVGLGRSLLGQERFDEAESLLLAGVGALEDALGADDDDVVEARATLVELYTRMGRPAEADGFRAPTVQGSR